MNNENKSRNGYYTVEEIIDRRKTKGKYEYLIKWKGYAGQNTWEPIQNLQNIQGIINKYDKIYENKKMSKNRKQFTNHKRKKFKEIDENKEEKALKKKSKRCSVPYILVDDKIEKVITVSKENDELVADIEKKGLNGEIVRERMKTKDLKKVNPWVLINFYESNIRFNEN